jgi:hypothetical protein
MTSQLQESIVEKAYHPEWRGGNRRSVHHGRSQRSAGSGYRSEKKGAKAKTARKTRPRNPGRRNITRIRHVAAQR